MDKLTDIVDKGGCADVFYLDFAKAFDKVPQERLLIKLRAKGVTVKLLDWIRSWLSGRTQRVRIGNCQSKKCSVDSSVPQGTVLGPPLFIIYIDDIDEAAIELDLLLKFADDTKGIKEIVTDSDRNKLQETLNKITKWAEKWAMKFNVKKCKILHVGRGNPGHDYEMDGEKLQEVETEKDIGIMIHKDLKPARQCQKAAGTAGAVLRQITRNFYYRDKKVFKQLYCQYVRPHLEFATPASSPWLETDIELLERVQKKAVKQVVGLVGSTYEERCAELDIDTLRARREMADLIQVYKTLKCENDVNIFKRAENMRNTRQNADPHNLVCPRARLDVRKYSFTVRAVYEWNRLPYEIKNVETIHQFKNALKHLYRRPVGGNAAGN